MPFSNLEYLYDHFPARYRRDDTNLFLKRFLTWFGETLDGFDGQYSTLHEKINPQTAPEEWIKYVLSFFGWGWAPSWFALEQLRSLLGFIAQLYARRGTVQGIQECMAFFGAPVIVEAQKYFWGEEAWDAKIWLTEPLVIIVRVLHGALLSEVEIDELLRFMRPIGHIIYIEYLPEEPPPSSLDGVPLIGETLIGE